MGQIKSYAMQSELIIMFSYSHSMPIAIIIMIKCASDLTKSNSLRFRDSVYPAQHRNLAWLCSSHGTSSWCRSMLRLSPPRSRSVSSADDYNSNKQTMECDVHNSVDDNMTDVICTLCTCGHNDTLNGAVDQNSTQLLFNRMQMILQITLHANSETD